MHFSTENMKGQIMYVVVNDFEGKAASAPDMVKAMAEHGWPLSSPKVIYPRLSELEGEGALIKDGGVYRTPKKVKVDVEWCLKER